MPVEDSLPGVGLLPPRLDALLRGLGAVSAQQVVIRGWGSPCSDDEHRLRDWVTGVFKGRHLVIRVCELCEAAEVRDRTVTVTPVRGGVMRDSPDILLGWYSGARRNQRTYS